MWTKEKASAKETRADEKAVFDKVHAEETEAIDAMDVAISSIAAASAFVQTGAPGAPGAFVQASKQQWSKLTEMAAHSATLMSFLQEVPGPDTKSFESSSGGVDDAVKGLKGKMEEQRAKLEKEESDAVSKYEVLMQ